MKVLLCLIPWVAGAFVVDPWIPPIAEFEYRVSYTYRYYPDVQNGVDPSNYFSNDQLLNMNLGVAYSQYSDIQLEADFSHTKRLAWGAQRFGVQGRYLCLDDVSGDPCSLVFGSQLFYVPTRNMRDVSSPYHAQGNLALNVACGKEFDQLYMWIGRFWAFLEAGIGNRGSLWLTPQLVVEANISNRHQFKLFSNGYFGLGNKCFVDVSHFNGYGDIRHQSIDIGIGYTYLFDIWGKLRLQYVYRGYARAFPARTSLATIEYQLPFSIF